MFILNVADFLSRGFDGFRQEIFRGVYDEVVGWGIFIFFASETSLEFGDAVKPVISFFLADDSPEIVALDATFSGFGHSGEVKKGGGGVFCSELRGDAVMIASFVPIKNHEVHRKSFSVFSRGVHKNFVVF